MSPLPAALGLAGVLVANTSSADPREGLVVHLVHRCPPTTQCLPPRILAGMRSETGRIWSSLDVQIVWIDSVDAGRAAVAGLTVLIEEGVDPVWPPNRGLLLARLHQPAGACQWGLVHVWVRQIRRHVASVRRDGKTLTMLPTALADSLLQRALGRVLAHEIGHYLLGTANHARYGLMRAHFSPQELLEDAIQPLYGLNRQDRAALLSRCGGRAADAAVADR